MGNRGRAVIAVVAGAAAWAVLWIAGTRAAQTAFPQLLQPEQPITHVGMLAAYIAYSACLSVLAGLVTATVRGRDPMPMVWVLAALQLTFGIVAEVAYWSLMPVWYHVVFLMLIVPATISGGVLAVHRRGRVDVATA